jgi:LysR family glycine cleavage system transcriptional activator
MRLPPLRSLEAFVAVGRHLSFKQAAADLHLSASAVSRRVQALETDLGVVLFHRLTRAIEFTDAGRAYFERIAPAFAAVVEATAAARELGTMRSVTVTLPVSLAAEWLMPRLPDFWRRHQDISVEVETGPALTDLVMRPGTVGIRVGAGDWPKLTAERLIAAPLSVVCSPALLDGPNAIRSVADLAGHRLLQIAAYPQIWDVWLERAGHAGLRPRARQTFDNMQVLYQAAADGHGVALGTDVLVRSLMSIGRLVEPFPERHDLGIGYHLVYPAGRLDDPAVRIFAEWLRHQAST